MIMLKLRYLELREEEVDGSKLKINQFLANREGYLQLECEGLTNQNGFSLFGLLSYPIRF